MRLPIIILSGLFFLIGCASMAGSSSSSHNATVSQAQPQGTEMALMNVIVEQAFMIEALQGEIAALQEGGAKYGYVYAVRQGESLWRIAEEVLGDPYKWMTIYTMNVWMGDPDLIYPHQILVLP